MALRRHTGVEKVGKVGREALWRLLPEEECIEERAPRRKAIAGTPLLGEHARSPN